MSYKKIPVCCRDFLCTPSPRFVSHEPFLHAALVRGTNQGFALFFHLNFHLSFFKKIAIDLFRFKN